MSARRHRWLRWVIAGLVTVLVLAVAGPFIFFRFVAPRAPAPLTLPELSATARGTSAASIEGTWTAGKGSLAGYRVREVFLGQGDAVVGRTSAVTCTIVVAHTALSSGSCRVDLTTMKSNGKRQPQFGPILDTANHPDATFSLTKPIVFGSSLGVDKIFTATATGSLAIRGVTRSVTFPIAARYTGSLLEAAGSIPVVFSAWNIKNPGYGSLFTTQDHGVLEFLLYLHR